VSEKETNNTPEEGCINSFVPLLEKKFTVFSLPPSLHDGDAELEKSDAERIKSNIASVLHTKEGRTRSMLRRIRERYQTSWKVSIIYYQSLFLLGG
jgi:hypothetical protein